MPENLMNHIDCSKLFYSTGANLTVSSDYYSYVKDCVSTGTKWFNIGDTDGDHLPDISEEYTPERIIRNGPVTVVFWKDKTKTIVRLKEGSDDNPYMAFCSALAKKIFGNNSKVNRIAESTKIELPKEMKK